MEAPTLAASAKTEEIAVSRLLDGCYVAEAWPHAHRELLRLPLRDGVDVLWWGVRCTKPWSVRVRDDWDRIHFSCALAGRSGFQLEGAGKVHGECLFEQGQSCISRTLGDTGRSSYASRFEQLTVSLRPDVLADWVPDIEVPLAKRLATGRCCSAQRGNAEFRAVAQALGQVLRRSSQRLPQGVPPTTVPLPSAAWLLGQSLVMVGLSVEAHQGEQAPGATVSPSDRRNLLRARDMLLADLSQAPTIDVLARACGLSAVKLKRGFRLLFDQSVYGLFQHERMHEARQRLGNGHTTVTVVAADLGYANASHFAAAFQKQFGIPPSAFKRRR